MYGDEERTKKMEKGEHLKRQNRPTMLQLQYLQGLSKVEKKRGAQGSIAEYYGVNRSTVNRYFKNCIERGILTESLEFTPAGEEWLERYSNLYENLEKYLEEIGAKPEEIEESLDVMVENIDIHMLELMINAYAEKKSVYKKKENELDQEIQHNLQKCERHPVVFRLYRMNKKQGQGRDSMAMRGFEEIADQLHICYCHSPVRYVWDMYNEYLEEANLAEGFKSWLVRYMLHNIRKWDMLSSFRVDYFISNSDYVGRRIKETYRRNSVTIHPNIDISNFEYCNDKQNYYLASSRLVAYKKIDIIIEAFNRMPDKKLIVIGGGPNLKNYKELANENITVMGYQPFNLLKEKMQHAKAFIFAADEDFGMIPIEAEACGTPVIAYGHGGSLETVCDGKTGMFFYEQTADAIVNAVKEFETMGSAPFKYEDCRSWAERFSEERFKREIKEFVEEKYKEFNK